MLRSLLPIVVRCCALAALNCCAVAVQAADEAGIEFYEKRVRPILVEHCYECHGPNKQEASLQVDSVGAMLRGGDQGPAIVPGDADESLLIKGVRYDDINFQMPPKGKLAPEKIAALEQWVRDGAAAPAGDQSKPAAAVNKFNLAERAKHWCFQPLGNSAPPQVRDTIWPRTEVDRYILAKLEAANLKSAPPAEPYELIRRLSFDLIGLPPTAAEVEDFVAKWTRAQSADERERIYADLVDRLLASPHFGERWARHWLDLVRYAETRGHEFDHLIPNAYQYRDYVIRALNADVPYDRFVVEHLAGDLLAEPRRNPTTGGNESILGTGFWFLGEEVHSPVDIRQDETDRIDNKIDVMSKTFLGLTLACARCHDHKFDALSTKDYYAMSGFVLGLSYRQTAFETDEHNRKVFEAVGRLETQHRAKLLAAQAELLTPVAERAERYLLGVRDVLLELRAEGAKANRDAVLTTIANQYALDEKRLAAWVKHCETATTDASDPLVAWAALIDAEPSSAPSKPAMSALGGLAPHPTPPRIVVDFASLAQSDWLIEGFAFGDRPARPGDVQVGTSPQRPLARLFERSAAAVDPKWDFIRTAPDCETEPGRLNWQQVGRTLKTPTITLSSGRLWYRVRGSGRVYAAVASHRLNNGPLHAQLIKSFAGPPTWRWVEHDLTPYVGHRLHLEFSPNLPEDVGEGNSATLEIAEVVESPTRPDEDAPPAFEVTAQSLAERFQRAVRALADDRLTSQGTAASADMALASWMIDHEALFSTPSPQAAELTKSFFTQQAEHLASLRKTATTAPAAWRGSGVDEHVLIRGNHRTTGDLVPRRFLEAFDGETPRDYREDGRLALAERLIDASDPLPARVMVNRLWQHMFGVGLVRTSDNFGSMGDLPTHPELLDHLASEFIAGGWSIKRALRTMALSQTYRMSSSSNVAVKGSADPALADPQNKLLHRANVKRLEAEAIRDSMLAVSGRLDRKLFGPSVETYLTPFMEGRGRPQSGPLDGLGRRSIYLRVRRNFLNPMFQAFDYPTPFTSVGLRTKSNVPAQALALMNGPLVVEQAQTWAERVLRETPQATVGERIDRLYRECFARRATATEQAAAAAFISQQAKLHGTAADDVRPWADLCHVLWNTKEFIYIP